MKPKFAPYQLFVLGFIVSCIGIFFPCAVGESDLHVWDFQYFGAINIAIPIAAFLSLSMISWIIKRVGFALASAACTLLLEMSVIFMTNQWQPALRSRFYLDFLKVAGPGWYLMLIGTCVMLVISTRCIPDRKRAPYLFILPMLAGVCFLTFLPAIFAVFISLRKWSIVVPNKPFVGLANFERAVSDAYWWRSLWISFKYAIGVIPIKIIAAYFFALLIYTIPKFKSLFRTVYFLPVVTSTVAIAVIWNWIYHPYYGLANYLLKIFGLPPADWLGDPRLAIWSVALVSAWHGIGYDVIIFLAGLNGIPKTVLEAAMVDGATRWQRLRYIITPLMKPSLVFVLITSTISAVQVFTQIYMMTGGGANTKTAVYYIWEHGFGKLQMGYASALSLILFAIILVITLIQIRVTKFMKEG